MTTLSPQEAMRLALDALLYHTAQTRPIQLTEEAVIALRSALAASTVVMHPFVPSEPQTFKVTAIGLDNQPSEARPTPAGDGAAFTCRLTECQGKPKCKRCVAMDAALDPDTRYDQAMQIINAAWAEVPEVLRKKTADEADDPTGNPLPAAVRALAAREPLTDTRTMGALPQPQPRRSLNPDPSLD